MNLKTLYIDELRGLARSKVMIALWVGLPVLSLIFYLAQPETEGLPLLTLVAVLVGGIGGTLSAVLLSTTITNERNKHVYDLFLIRPVGRGELLVAKFFAAFTCLLVAAVVSMGMAVVVDMASGTLAPGIGRQVGQSLLISLAGMTIASAVGVLFGVLIDSIAVSAILSVYLGNQLSAIIILPTILVPGLNVTLFASLVGLVVPAAVMTAAGLVFRRKSL
jgi:ABC-2 type transport system permease protein